MALFTVSGMYCYAKINGDEVLTSMFECIGLWSVSLLQKCVRTVASVIPSRGYKTDPDKGKAIFGDQYPKIPIYYGFKDGKRETDPDAVKRFYRLHWGGWIRTKAGRRKRLWRKSADTRWWCKQHILLDDRTSANLEKMITPEYKKERFIVDDPYEPYHKRHNFDHLPRGKFKQSKSYIQLMWEY